MLAERGLVMMPCSAGAPVADGGVTEGSAVLVDDGPELSLLIAEVDTILCDAAATLLRPPPSPPVTARALAGPRSPGRSGAISGQPWSAPAPDVHAVQRGPPRARTRKKWRHNNSGRQVMGSQRG
jgi:hypothetical protein